jgi:hypothetical protein
MRMSSRISQRLRDPPLCRSYLLSRRHWSLTLSFPFAPLYSDRASIRKMWSRRCFHSLIPPPTCRLYHCRLCTTKSSKHFMPTRFRHLTKYKHRFSKPCTLWTKMFLLAPQQVAAIRSELILASIIAALTFKVAYRSSLVLGTVLLRTSPRQGLSNGKMEAFLRAIREVRAFFFRPFVLKV